MALNRDPEPRPPNSPPARVLVVDDNKDIITVTRRILEHQDYQILTAMDGKTALEIAQRELPHLILLDVMLPEMDGLEVCRRLKGNPETRQLMILLVTGRGSVDHRVEGLEAGADDYIVKPFHLTELLARVRSALRIKRLTEEIEARNRQLIESERERLKAEKLATIGLLATGIAHEFNNIMSGISGYAQLARKKPAFKDQLIEVTLTQSERALELTKSLSTYYQPSARRSSTDIVKTIDTTLCLVLKELSERGIRLEKDFQPVPPVWAHSGQLQEVFLNLLINSIHAIDRDGTITIRVESAESGVRVSVIDSGCGIPPENLDRIFDPFFTTKGALGGGSATGSGLGLSVSYNIIKSHGGDIKVSSRVGGGSTFAVTLPASLAGASKGGGPAPAAKSAAADGMEPGGEGSTLLVADPSESIREMAEKYLRNFHVVGCSSWKEMSERLEKEKFAAVILDTSLPVEGSFCEAFEGLTSRHPETVFILTSNQLGDENLRRSQERADGHLLKPYTVENLMNLLVLETAA